jgi:hypothetical protein
MIRQAPHEITYPKLEHDHSGPLFKPPELSAVLARRFGSKGHISVIHLISRTLYTVHPVRRSNIGPVFRTERHLL